MPSNYEGVEWKVEHDGIDWPVTGEVVKVHDVTDSDPTDGTGAVALPDLATDGAGIMAGGVLAAVAPGRTVRFTVVRAADGLPCSVIQVTS
jgi:hypothetical protein